MARGHPDYFGTSIFPYYGTSDIETFSGDATPHTTIEILKVEGKGVLYQMQVLTQGFLSAAIDRIIFSVNGTEFMDINSFTIYARNIKYPVPLQWHILEFDKIGMRYGMFFSGPLPFGKSIIVEYKEVSGNDPLITASLQYSRIA